jgi:hypothetical protein
VTTKAALDVYLDELRRVRATRSGTAETSYYPAVALLLNGECRIGGYQVLKKWLSYRDHSITGRPLAAEEVGHLQQTARRIAAILLLGSDLDSSYRACAAEHRLLSLSENNLV